MTTHAKHGPSSLKNKEICPHWVNRPGSSAAADEGTKMHEAAETGRLDELNPEQIAQVRECLVAVDEMQLEIPGCIRYPELQVDVCGLTFGTADVVLIGTNTATVIDYKMGRIPVDDAEDNAQGWAYALGVFDLFGVDSVKVVFLQPRCDLRTEHTFTRENDYQRMRDRVAAVIEKAEDPKSPYNPHPDNCQYCGAKALCPALTAKAMMVAEKLPERLELPQVMDPLEISEPEQMALALRLAPVLIEWADAVKSHALEMVRNGQEIPGYQLKHRSGRRVIKQLESVWDIVHAEFDLPLEGFLPACSISVTSLEKAVTSIQERGQGAKAIRRLNQLLTAEGLCTTDPEITYLAKERM
jgi:CRISPR/Cas system-associated exonuclease Cas4 (RecB family)